MSPRSTDNDAGLEVLVVSPRQARKLLGISNTLLYRLIGDKSLASYHCGRSRRIPMSAIKDYIARRVAENAGKRPRGRPRKHPLPTVAVAGQPEAQAEVGA
jgi:excisionase family DNA binding protein